MELKIYRPCISRNLTQGWGENRACLGRDGRIFGVPKGKSCPGQSFYQSIGLRGHNGIDIAGLTGADIYHSATFDGWMKTETDRMGGIGVDVVSHSPLFFAGPIPPELQNTAETVPGGFQHYVKMRYWHLHAPVGHDRKRVRCGDIIGLMGNTGASSNTHAHFAPKWCDRNGNGVGKANGYFGAFDPTPYYIHSRTGKEQGPYVTGVQSKLSPQEYETALSQLSTLQQLLVGLQRAFHSL